MAVAPILTGLLIDNIGADVGWRASFLWNVPIGIVVIVLGLRWLPFGPERQRKLARKNSQFVRQGIDLDPLGTILLSVTVLVTMAPFMLRILVAFLLLILVPVLVWFWIRWERSYSSAGHEPMVDLSLFGIRSFTQSTIISGLQFFAVTSLFVVVPLFVQKGLGASAILAGVIGLPNAVATAISSIWSGRRAITSGRRIVVWGFCLSLLGSLLLIAMSWFVGPQRSAFNFMWLAVPLAVSGLAVGAVNTCNQTLSQEDIPARIGGTAGAVKQMSERIGTAMGTAMITAVFFWVQLLSYQGALSAAVGVMALVQALALICSIIDLRILGDGRGLKELAVSQHVKDHGKTIG